MEPQRQGYLTPDSSHSLTQSPPGPPPYPYKDKSFPPFDADLPFWPTLKRHLISFRRNPFFRSKPLPAPICTLCRKGLCIPHLNLGSEQDAGADPTVILPCGHMFHHSCAARLFASYSKRNHHPHCPVCNLALRYANPAICGHSLAPFVLGTAVPPPPPTIPEGGAIPVACTACRVRQSWYHLHQAETMLVGEDAGGPAAWWMYDPLGDTDETARWAERARMAAGLHHAFRGVIWGQGEMERRRPTWAGPWAEMPRPDWTGQPCLAGAAANAMMNGAAGGGAK
ncbi:hypothetical protein MFIFM68171_10189 [Madurella fahalii]|uniref:RING-type domain-containing protein n=1 Tax=Madurella fahalii TaxID=1157608 RepID=A0ABQ0GQF3_9PEZI